MAKTIRWESFGGELWCPDELVVVPNPDTEKDLTVSLPKVVVEPPYGWTGGVAAGLGGLPDEQLNERCVKIAEAIAKALSELEL